MPKTRPLTTKGDEVAMRVTVTLEEIEGVIDAIENASEEMYSSEDREFYRGLLKRWKRHEGDFHRSLLENLKKSPSLAER